MHMPLVEYLARRFSGRNEPLPDLVQVGAIGLLKSIDRFDPDRGLSFPPTRRRQFSEKSSGISATPDGWYTCPGGRRNSRRRSPPVGPSSARNWQRAPTVAELAERTGLREEDIIEALDAARGCSGVPLDALTDEDHGGNAARGHVVSAR